MAFRKPTSLACPTCGLHGDVVLIVHVGPNSKETDGPAHRSINRAGPFEKQGNTLTCPKDGTKVWPQEKN